MFLIIYAISTVLGLIGWVFINAKVMYKTSNKFDFIAITLVLCTPLSIAMLPAGTIIMLAQSLYSAISEYHEAQVKLEREETAIREVGEIVQLIEQSEERVLHIYISDYTTDIKELYRALQLLKHEKVKGIDVRYDIMLISLKTDQSPTQVID